MDAPEGRSPVLDTRTIPLFPRQHHLTIYAHLLGLIVLMVVSGKVVFDANHRSWPPRFWYLEEFLAFVALWDLYLILFNPIAVEFRDDRTVAFRGRLRTSFLKVDAIRSVERTRINLAGPIVHHEAGRLRLLLSGPFAGFDDFVDRLRALNPAVEIREP